MTDEDTIEPTSDETPDAPNPEQGSGFEQPERAQWARFRRFDLETAMWTDSPVIYHGKTTAWVPAADANPGLTIADPIPTTYRITWVDTNRRPVGYSKAWRILEQAGGASNTPRMWPLPMTDRHNLSAPSRSALTPDETVRLLDGLARVVTETSRPLIMQIEAFHEGALARERAFHEQQRRVDEANFQRTLERDRTFMAAMRDVHERPRDQRIGQLEQELAALRADDDDDETKPGNPWDLAGKVLENAPEIIRTVAQEVRRGGAAAEAAEAAAEALTE